jgi:hypothetical protein
MFISLLRNARFFYFRGTCFSTVMSTYAQPEPDGSNHPKDDPERHLPS